MSEGGTGDSAPASVSGRTGSESLRRAGIVGVLVAVLVGVGIADGGRSPSLAAPGPDALSAVRVAPPHVESSAWYCAGGTGAQGVAPTTLVLTNTTSRLVTGTMTTVPAVGTDRSISIGVAADSELRVGPSELPSSGYLAVTVVLDGGGVSVAEAVSSPLGWSMAPCASSSAAQWYFAHGATSQGGGMTLSLFNPSATDTVVSVSLVSATGGFLSPPAYQGIDVPSGSLVIENIGDHASNDPQLAIEVSTLSGTVVAAELQSIGQAGNGGITLTPGAPAPAPVWAFPQNTDVIGGTVTFHVLNPSARAAVVSVQIGLPQGAAAEPLTLRVPAQATASLVAEKQTRIPTNVVYAATFVSAGGVGIVVDRQVSAPVGLPPPTPEHGDVPGVGGGARHWLVPAVVPPGSGAWSVAVVGLGHHAATVRFLTGAGRPVPGLGPRVVQPGSPLVIGPNPGAPFGSAPFRVVSDEAVAVELDALPVGSPGVVVVPALVLG